MTWTRVWELAVGYIAITVTAALLVAGIYFTL